MKKILFFMSLLIITACGNEQGFQRFDDYEKPPLTSMNYPVKAIERTNSQVDILWIIDNSLSMDDIQQNVITNTGIFMQEFDKKGGIDWKMGLISTDESEPSYLGLNTRDGFNYRSGNRVQTFSSAVRSLGLNGSYTEKTFTPIMRHIGNGGVFVRENAMLVIVNVTDAEEQSSNVSVKQFTDFLTNLKGGDISRVKFYGVYSVEDFGCSGESRWNYVTSKYKPIVELTGGSTFPACAPDFGQKLTGLAKDIISYLQSSKIILKKRPKPETIRISYKGKVLKGGLQADGGMWYYDFNDNAIVFYSLDFAPGNEEIVKVEFDEDDGF